MTSDWSRALDRAKEEMTVARELLDLGHANQASSRAYFAAFYAATSALMLLGETRSKHSGAISAFNDKVVRAGGFEVNAARSLGWLFDLRNTADYRWDPIGNSDAEEAVERANRFVDTVEEWIEDRKGTENS